MVIIMNKNEKDFMNQLNNLDDLSVEEIAENYPALDEHSKKRILSKCMRKSGFSTGIDDDGREEIVVSGTERYNRAPWYKYAASAAAFVIAAVGITSVVLLHRNLNGDNDFELDNPPAVSSYDSEADNVSEQATATTKDRGYVAGGHDYANDTDYSGIIIGGTTQTPPTVDESSSGYTAEQGDAPVVNNNNNNNNTPVQPATQAPPVTAPPATQPVATAPPATEPVTDNATQSEAQKTYLSDLYYVEIEGVSGCMGFNFSPDGTLVKFAFNDYGNIMDETQVKCNYEIVGNQFSFGYLDSELNKRIGTIVNPNDAGNFIVQFDEMGGTEIWHFNVGAPTFMDFKEEIHIAGASYYGYSSYGERLFTFYDDGINGNYINTQDGIGLSFTYFINGDEITFHMGDNTNVIKAKIITDNIDCAFAFQWPDGVTEYFYYDSFR